MRAAYVCARLCVCAFASEWLHLYFILFSVWPLDWMNVFSFGWPSFRSSSELTHVTNIHYGAGGGLLLTDHWRRHMRAYTSLNCWPARHFVSNFQFVTLGRVFDIWCTQMNIYDSHFLFGACFVRISVVVLRLKIEKSRPGKVFEIIRGMQDIVGLYEYNTTDMLVCG